MAQKKVLGRGLGAFFPDMDQEKSSEKNSSDSSGEDKGSVSAPIPTDPRQRANVVMHVPVEHIRTNPYQPRTDFDELRLQELADSIRQHGLIQPVTVRHLGNDRFELIAGERRLRATRMNGMETIPAYIREVNDDDMIAFAIIENIQREELNAIEIAHGYQRLMDECLLTQEEVAKQVGKNRTTITNTIRLLNLTPSIQAALKQKKITQGHARALLGVEDRHTQEQLFNTAMDNEWSVRQLEDAVRKSSEKKKSKGGRPAAKTSLDIELREITTRLTRQFGTKVHLKKKKEGGEIRIEYYNDDDLNRILEQFEDQKR